MENRVKTVFCILCVDDDPDILELYESMIIEKGFKYIGAENGVEALEKIKDEEPQLVITDIKMPAMDGIALIKEIKKIPNHPYILIGTGYPEDNQKYLELGISKENIFEKPIQEQELLDVIGTRFLIDWD